MKKIISLALILFMICAVTAGVLGGVNAITASRIQALADAKTAQAYAAVLKCDAGYADVEFDSAKHPTVTTVSEAKDGAGWVVTSSFSGSQGMITMITGVSADYICTGISITEHSETSGLGANAASAGQVGIDFRAQFVGKDDSVSINDIDALTGATITSTAVANAVAESIRTVEDLG